MRRPVIFVLLAGFAALVAAMVVYSALKKREAEVAAARLQSVDIIVAAHELGIGSKLDASSVKTARWSRDSLPPGAFTDISGVMDKYTMSSFVENEPITADRLFSGDKNAGVLPLLIPPGMRALSVPVDEVSDIAGFVLPHAHVDVLVTVNSNDRPMSKIVLQDVEVLAIAQDIEQVGDKPQVVHVVTMLVTPDQAERLTLASGQGGLRLAMRNYDDKSVVATDGITVAQLLGAAPVAAPVAVQEHLVYAAPRPRPRRTLNRFLILPHKLIRRPEVTVPTVSPRMLLLRRPPIIPRRGSRAVALRQRLWLHTEMGARSRPTKWVRLLRQTGQSETPPRIRTVRIAVRGPKRSTFREAAAKQG